jgi:5-deoxy-glucuronate isomerase
MPDFDLQITPEEAGWGFCGLRVLSGEAVVDTGEDELIVLPLEGGATVTVDGETFTLQGRGGVWDGPTDFVYAPRDARVEISGEARLEPP